VTEIRWSLGQFLTHQARRYPDQVCFTTPDGWQQTFAETETRVNRLADALAARGLTKGDRIALLDTDRPAYMELLLACIKLGVSYVPLNYRLVESELANLLERARPTLLFTSARYLEVAGKVAGGAELAALDSCLPLSVESLVDDGADVVPDVVLADDDILGIMFTSGTTGLPKGVLQSHRMLKSMLFYGWELLPKPGDVRWTASPLFHIAGQFIVLHQMAGGAASMIIPQFDAQLTADLIADGRLTGVFLVPTMISSVLDLMGEPDPRERLDDLRYGSAPMPPSLLRRALARWPHVRFTNLFGAGTESGAQTYLRHEDHQRALAGEEHLLGSVGQPLLGVELRIVDDEGREVPRGTVGHVAARTDVVMNGYLDMPEESTVALRDGWFYGGDRGWMDEENYLYLGGRGRDMIIRGGENIYVAEIEQVLTDVPGVADAAVVGRADEHWGEVVIAFVEHTGAAPTEEQLADACRARLAGYKVPVEYHVLERLPRNPTGKVRKEQLKALLEEQPAPVAPA
jgi:acyl-CoA synthetase (AMP-forming)/AMP-acid ligase II